MLNIIIGLNWIARRWLVETDIIQGKGSLRRCIRSTKANGTNDMSEEIILIDSLLCYLNAVMDLEVYAVGGDEGRSCLKLLLCECHSSQ